MALRTDERVIDFIDCEAVKKAYSNTTMTLDAVLLEIEKDERYDQSQQSRTADQINHKEFITCELWIHFLVLESKLTISLLNVSLICLEKE